VPATDTRSSLAASGATVCAINVASNVIAVCRCCSPTSSHNAPAGAELSARSRRSCTTIGLNTIISLPADGTLQQRLQHPPRGEQIIKRPQRPGG
jgi:hypothetical protein